MNWKFKSALGIAALLLSAHAVAQVTFYEGVGFRGRAFTTDRPISNFQRSGFNDRASSVVVDGGNWDVCEDAGFQGNCVMLRPGSYESLDRMGMNKRISSVRPSARNGRRRFEAPEPVAQANYDYRRRPQERVYDVAVTSVHAVVGAPSQRCWMEREQVEAPRGYMNNMNIPGAVIGAIVGGVLGHQVGGGTGKDIATAGGAVAGAAIGGNVGRSNNGNYNDNGREVRRCEDVPSKTPEYWDVTYDFRGREHSVQMSAPPGPTITVNDDGEPRQ
jgi:uncharacterized protein YcfJ